MTQDGERVRVQGTPVGFLPARQVHREPLLGHGLTILHSGIAHPGDGDAGAACQPPCNGFGVFLPLAQQQPDMLALPRGFQQRQFADPEVFREEAQPATHRRLAPGAARGVNRALEGVVQG